jgi:Uma2 family endonuclease
MSLMADAARVVETMDVETFLAFLDERKPGERWELHDGVPRLMVGGTASHARIAGNIDRVLHEVAKRRGCEALRGILVAADDSSTFEPDVVVQCGPLGGQDRIASWVKIVFEVLSPSTMRYDRGLKFDGYRRMQSIEQIVFVYQDSVRVESYYRNGDSWAESPKVLVSRADSLALPILGASLELEAIYLDVTPSPLE